MMINKRVKARMKRMEDNERLVSWLEDAKAEREFERTLREEMADENTPISSLLASTRDGDWEFASGAYGMFQEINPHMGRYPDRY
jgi:hypothetical protein